MQRYEFMIEGMRCAACATRLERVLNRHPHLHAQISFAAKQASIEASIEEDAPIGGQEIIALIEEAGFKASFVDAYESGQGDKQYLKEKRALKWDFIISILCSIPIMLLMMGPFWLVIILMSIVQFWCGRVFYKYAFIALKNKHMTMDVLVALGTSIAYFYNLVALCGFLSIGFYPDTSAMVISLVLLGRLLELKARHKAQSAIDTLLQAQPSLVHKEVGNDIEDYSVSQLVGGEIIVIRPGEVVPVDGVIIEGQSEINESMLTGEALPVLRKEGDDIFAATLNHHAILRVKVTAVGQKTAFSKIVNFVKKAQSSKPNIQKIADRVTAYFVPVIILCAFLSFLGTFLWGGIFAASILHAVAVLVVACPCALGLATPMTLMVGTGKAAELGILFQDSDILERSQKVTAFLFDKTGTLTEGRPTLSASYICKPYDEAFLLSSAFALERHSEHPLASAVRKAFEEADLKESSLLSFASSVVVVPGKGLWAPLEDGGRAYIGHEGFLEENGISIPSDVATWLEQERSCAKIAFVVGWRDHVIGCLSFTDQIRSEARSLITLLKNKNIMPVMVTGDHVLSAQYAGKFLGIEQIKAGILPQEKAKIIRQLQAEGHVVAMIGDGLNDAPALSVADLSFAMEHGSALSLDSANIILMGNHLGAVGDALTLLRVIMHRIYQNLALAFLYNIICVPLAGLGYLTPIFASLCMALSSVSVVLNALRLKYWRPKN